MHCFHPYTIALGLVLASTYTHAQATTSSAWAKPIVDNLISLERTVKTAADADHALKTYVNKFENEFYFGTIGTFEKINEYTNERIYTTDDIPLVLREADRLQTAIQTLTDKYALNPDLTHKRLNRVHRIQEKLKRKQTTVCK